MPDETMRAELPALPAPHHRFTKATGAFSADQVIGYARAAILADRASRASAAPGGEPVAYLQEDDYALLHRFFETTTDGEGYQPLATLWRYELRSIRHGNLSIWGVERIGQGARARWFGQTWEVEWTSEESLRRRESIKTGELPPSIKQMYPDADDPDSPFA